MTRTRHARTAGRLVTASMTVPRSRTTLLASSAVSAVTPAIWLVTVPTGSGARAGVTTVQCGPARLALLVLAAAAMQWIASTRYVDPSSKTQNTSFANAFHSNSCKNSAALALLRRASKPGPGLMDPSAAVAAAMLGPGHVARPAVLRLGVPGTTTASTAALPMVLPLDLRVVLLRGLVTAATAIGIVAVTAARMVVMEATAIILATRPRTVAPQPPRAPLLGISPWARRPHMVDTQAMGPTELLALPLALLLESVLLLPACLPRLRPVARLPVCLVALTRSSSSTLMPSRLRLRRRREMRRRRPRRWTYRLLRRVLREDCRVLREDRRVLRNYRWALREYRWVLREDTSALTLPAFIVHWPAGMLLTDRMFC